MLELSSRERQLFSGLGVQLIVIGLLVFAYTQALRQVNVKRELYLKQKEQVALGRARVEKEGTPDIDQVRREVLSQWEPYLPGPSGLAEWAQRLEDFAEKEFHFSDPEVKVGSVTEETVPIPVLDGTSLEIQLYPIEMSAVTTAKNLALFLESLRQSKMKLLLPLRTVKLKKSKSTQLFPVAVNLKWWVAVLPEETKRQVEADPQWDLPERAALEWGHRRELFSSVFDKASAVKTPKKVRQKLRLSGIVWDQEVPTCVISGAVLKPGDVIDGYRLVVVTPKGVLLQKGEEEVFLASP